MTLRKIAGLLAAFGLTLGLIGGGVGAAFSDQVTGTENINVGMFDCEVVGVTAGGSFDVNSATYSAPQINSSAAGSAPFSFTVKNTGSIPMALTVSAPVWGGTLDGSFSGIAPTLSAVTLAPAASATVSTGIQWGTLDNNDLGDSGSATWTVACGEVPPAEPLPANTYVWRSTNDANIAKTPTKWANVVAVPGAGSVALTFTQPRAFYACFEYRTDGNVPEQRLQIDGVTVGPPFAPSVASTYGIVGVNDGRYKRVCLNVAGSTATVVVPVAEFVEVRISFGAEQDEWFPWTRFDALP